MSMTTVFYESIEDEEILFQPQGMKVQHVDMKKLRAQQAREANNKEYRERHDAYIKKEKEEQDARIKAGKEPSDNQNFIGGYCSWKLAFANHSLSKLIKITDKYITFMYNNKKKHLKILKSEKDNINYICFRNGDYNVYMRPIWFNDKTQMNHMSEERNGIGFPILLSDVKHFREKRFFINLTNRLEPYGEYANKL